MFILADFTCDHYPMIEVKKEKNKKHKQTKKKIVAKKISSKTLAEKTVGIVSCSKGKILIIGTLVKNDIKSPINKGKCKTKKIMSTTIRKNPRRG